VILPLLCHYWKLADTKLFALALLVMLCFMCSGCLLYFWKSTAMAMLLWTFFGLSFMANPITNGALSKRLTEKEQGMGMGFTHAVKGLTFAIAPMLFGGLYNAFEHSKPGWLKTMPFFIGFVVILTGFPILFGSLQTVMNEYDDNRIREQKDRDEEKRQSKEAEDEEQICASDIAFEAENNTDSINVSIDAFGLPSMTSFLPKFSCMFCVFVSRWLISPAI